MPSLVLSSISQSKLLETANKLLEKLALEGGLTTSSAKLVIAGSTITEADIDAVGINGELDQAAIASVVIRALPAGIDQSQVDLLQKRLRDLDASTDKGIELALLEAGVTVNEPPLTRLDLLVKAGADIKLAVEPCARLSSNGAADCSLVRIGLTGNLNGAIDAGLNQGPVSLALSGGTGATHSVSCFLRGDPGATVAEQVLDGLTVIRAHPSLDMAAILALLSEPGSNVDAIQVAASQEWRFGGSLKIGRGFDLGGGNSVVAAFEVGFTLKERGTFEYLLSDEGGGLSVAVRRGRLEESVTSEGISFEFDLSGLADKLYPRILDKLDEGNTAIEKVLALLPEKEFLRAVLTRELGKRLGDFELKAEVLAAVGLDPTKSLEDRITARITDLIMAAGELYDDKTSKAAERILDEVLGRLRLPPNVDDRLKKQLGAALQRALSKVHEHLRDEVENALRSDGSRFKKALKALSQPGDNIDAILAHADERIEAVVKIVRGHLGTYQRLIAKVAAYLESEEARRITLKLSAETKATRSDEALVELRFHKGTLQAPQLLRRLLLGDAQTVFAIARDDSNPAVTLIKGSLTRYASFIEKKAIDFVVLGFDIGQESLLSAETQIVESADGVMVITTKNSYQLLMKSLFDDRRFNFVNLYQLSNAQTAGTASLSFSIDKEEDGTDPESAKAFVKDALALGILDPGDVADLDQAYAQIAGAEHSRLTLGISLSQDQLARLIAWGKPPAGSQGRAIEALCEEPKEPRHRFVENHNPFAELDFSSREPSHRAAEPAPRPVARGEIIARACETYDRVLPLADASAFHVKKVAEALREAARYRGNPDRAPATIGTLIRDLDQIVLHRTRHGDDPNGGIMADNEAIRAKEWLRFRHAAAVALADEVLVRMWAVYHSGSSALTRERYQHCQLKIARAVEDWFDRPEQHVFAVGLGTKDKMRPVLLALLKTLLDLADADLRAPGPVLAMKLEAVDDKGKVVKSVPISA